MKGFLMPVQELYTPFPMAANATLPVGTPDLLTSLGGFICVTSGNFKLAKGPAGAGAAIVDTMPVVAGGYYPLAMALNEAAAIVLSAGASGTVLMTK